MSIALDGFDVLRRLGAHAGIFTSIRADVDKAARVLVVKCLKAKSVGIDALRDIQKALGDNSFELVLEGLKDGEVTSLLTRLDQHHPELKLNGAAPAWRRQHLKALAAGTSHPSAPPAKQIKARKKTSIPEPPRLQSEALDVFRQGGKDKY
ncbi:hypothetical protein [Bradyrhizobium sp.]|jgi:hypothetical protein|uniref:hypothetical protein n=1 Tax=Bradyrhizobium sp. TaxID=376 RepID=UPI003C24A967